MVGREHAVLLSFSVAVIEFPEKQLKGERIYFRSWFEAGEVA